MRFRTSISLFLLILIAHAGCGPKFAGGPLKTTPLTGTVYVDGEPASGVVVECLPEGDSEIKHPVIASTDEKGDFSISMYLPGDGLPAGSYSLAFRWHGYGPRKSDKKDKLNGAYADPKKSKHKVTIVDGEPNDLGIIELSTKAPDK